MTKNAKIVLVLIAVLLIAGGVYYASKNNVAKAPQGEMQGKATTSPELNPVTGQTVSNSIPKTNPFETQVNPYDAYKNPFNQ